MPDRSKGPPTTELRAATPGELITTPGEWVARRHEREGVPIPDALAEIQALYEDNDPAIKNLKGIKKFADNFFVSGTRRAGRVFGLETLKTAAYPGSKLGIPIAERELESIKAREQLTPSGSISGGIGKLGSLLVGGKALREAGLERAAATIAGKIVGAGAETIIPLAARARQLAKYVIEPATEFSILEGAKGEGFLKGAAEGAIGGLTIAGAGKVAIETAKLLRGSKFFSRILPLDKIVAEAPVQRALSFLARRHGISNEEMAARLQTSGELIDAVTVANADDSITRELATVLEREGIKESQRLGPQVDLPESIQGQPAFKVSSRPGRIRDIPDILVPRELETGKLPNRALDQVVEGIVFPGGPGEKIVGPFSRFRFSPAGRRLVESGDFKIKRTLLKKPLVVDVGPNEVAYEAAVKALYNTEKEAATVLDILSSDVVSSDVGVSNAIANEFIARKAFERGYRAIIYKGQNPIDDVVHDLSKFKRTKIENIDEVFNLARRRVREAVEDTSKAGNFERTYQKTKDSVEKKLKIKIKETPISEPPAEVERKAILEKINQLNRSIQDRQSKEALGVTEPLIPPEPEIKIPERIRLNSRLTANRSPYPIREPADVDLTTIIAENGETTTIDTPLTHYSLYQAAYKEIPKGGKPFPEINGTSWVRAWRTGKNKYPEIGVNYDETQRGAENAANYLARNFRKGDRIVVDTTKEFKDFRNLEDALKFIRKKSPSLFGRLKSERGSFSRKKLDPAEDALERGSLDFNKLSEEEKKAHFRRMADRISPKKAKKKASGGGEPPRFDSAHSEFNEGNPEEFLTPAAKETAAKWHDRLSSWQLFTNNSDRPEWLWWANRVVTSKEQFMHVRVPRVEKQAKVITDKVPAGKSIDFVAHAAGLEKLPNGTWRQTGGPLKQQGLKIDNQLNELAIQFRKEIVDPIYEMWTGIDSRAPAILKQYKLKETPTQWERLRRLQEIDPPPPIPPKGYSIQELQAAQDTEGMLNWNGRNHDLGIIYDNVQLYLKPIFRERKEIIRRIEELAVKTANKTITPEESARLAQYRRRIKLLNEEEARIERGRLGIRDILAKRQAFGPVIKFKEVKTRTGKIKRIRVGGLKYDKFSGLLGENLGRSVNEFISGAYSKRRFDILLDDTRTLHGQLNALVEAGDNDAAKLIDKSTEWMQIFRGMAGVREDSRIAAVLNRPFKALFGRPMRVDDVRQLGRIVGSYQYISKLAGLPFRFLLMNGTQYPMTVLPVVRNERAFWYGMEQLMFNTKKAWSEAMEAGIVTPQSVFEAEFGGNVPSKFLDWINTPITLEEAGNRVMAFHAGIKDYLIMASKGQKPSKVMKTFVPRARVAGETEAEYLYKNAVEYGKAMSRATQFNLGQEGKSQIYAGGTLRGNLGQFKGYTAGYLTLLRDIIRYKEYKMGTKMLLTLSAFGGVAAPLALAPAASMYDLIRRAALKNGINLPDSTFVGWLWDMAELNEPTFQNNALENIRQFIDGIDLTRGIAVNLPQAQLSDTPGTETASRFVQDTFRFLAGPTISQGLEAIPNVQQALFGEDKERALENLGRGISPFSTSMVEALQEAVRGYVASRSEVNPEIIAERSPGQIAARAFNLQPSVNSQRYNYIRKIEDAIVYGREELIDGYLDEMERKGLIIGPVAERGLKSRITTRLRRQAAE